MTIELTKELYCCRVLIILKSVIKGVSAMLAYLKEARGLSRWYVVKREKGRDFYLHPDGTWHPTTGLSGYEGFPGLYQSQAAAVRVAASVMNYAVVFEKQGDLIPSKAFLNADLPPLALRAFLMNFFGPEGQVLNPPPPIWVMVYRSEDALDLSDAQLLLKWVLPEEKVRAGFTSEGAERASIIQRLLDKIKPIPENAPADVREAIDQDRQLLAMRAGWTSMTTEELRAILPE